MTEVKLMVKCCARKITRNNPDNAIATFLAIDEDRIPDIACFYLFATKIGFSLFFSKFKEFFRFNLEQV
jgi:hypothetical protein